MNFTDEEFSVIFLALEFIEDKYLTKRAQFIKEQLLKKIGERPE